VITRTDPAAAAALVRELTVDRIPARFGLAAPADVQVLTPMHRGPLGTQALNQILQAR
jgi:exodeoxyribonuclease V alpha subunit